MGGGAFLLDGGGEDGGGVYIHGQRCAMFGRCMGGGQKGGVAWAPLTRRVGFDVQRWVEEGTRPAHRAVAAAQKKRQKK